MDKVLFVLGAGASNALVGTPLGKELVWEFGLYDNFSRIMEDGTSDNPRNSKKFKYYKRFLKKVEEYDDELKGILDIFESGDNVLIILNRLNKEHAVDEILKKALKYKDDEFVAIIRWLIFQHLIHYQNSCNKYNDFKDYLLKVKEKNLFKFNIISFNFDCYLHTGITEENYFDYKVKLKPIKNNLYNFRKYKICDLIKPHGSIDWWYCPKCNEKYIRFCILGTYTFDSKICQKCYDVQLKPLILLPNERNNEFYNELMNESKERIKWANKIIIIGYSFPEYDEDIKKIFSDNTNNDTKIHIIDFAREDKNKKDIKCKIKKIFENIDNNNFTFYFDGFEQWLKDSMNY